MSARSLRRSVFLLGLGLGVLCLRTPSQDGAGDAAQDLLAQARPGPEHELLEEFAGEWDVTHSRPATSDGTEEPSGTARSSMILGGRFLQIEYSYREGDETTEGVYLLGFDRRNERYELVSLDTAGTYFIVSRGDTEDEDGRRKLYGQDDDPSMKSLGFDKEFGHVLDLRDPEDWSVQTLYIDTRTADRTELPGFELRFQRRF